ncbi:uncharacterized protein LOC34622208 [Cyclospora cayetanensis]|uniref:Phosphoglycerate kinase n=1 Tax=Cyclospora cayetanensis TaxID=88456 RepID=A0A6P6RTC5_9EIME|nr:uncharacterized protein LOC34622208 [Cyclospora cayetanensis]
MVRLRSLAVVLCLGGVLRYAAGFRFQGPQGLSPLDGLALQRAHQQHGLPSAAAAAAPKSRIAALASSSLSAPPPAAEDVPASLMDVRPSFFKGKRVLVRGDLNVAVMEDSSNSTGYRVTDDTRMRALEPTLRYLLDAGARVLLLSHFGDPQLPQQQQQPRFSLKMLLQPLQQMLRVPVHFAHSCVGEETESMANQLNEGEVLLLENVRLNPGEKENSAVLGSQVASLCDVYVNDAFGAAHRRHASLDAAPRAAVQEGKAALAGLLMLKELQAIQGAVSSPERPVCWIVGGAKVSSKAQLLRRLLSVSSKGDKVLVGGCMALTFLKARGAALGASLVEDSQLETCKEVEALAAATGVELMLPVDLLVGAEASPTSEVLGAPSVSQGVPEGLLALDHGPRTNELFADAIKGCNTIVW